MPQIKIEDGVMNVDEYDGVRTKHEFITQFNSGIGAILTLVRFFYPEGWMLKIGLIVLAVGVGS